MTDGQQTNPPPEFPTNLQTDTKPPPMRPDASLQAALGIFENHMRDEGMAVREAVIEGVRVRLRPVTMTVLSTVLGSLPLILSQGPGVEARRAIGWVIFGGLGLSALFTLYLAPLGYALIAPLFRPRAHAGQRLDAQLQRAVQPAGSAEGKAT